MSDELTGDNLNAAGSYGVRSAMPQPYVLLIYKFPSDVYVSPHYRMPIETNMASQQECEEALAALGSKFRAECVPGGRRF